MISATDTSQDQDKAGASGHAWQAVTITRIITAPEAVDWVVASEQYRATQLEDDFEGEAGAALLASSQPMAGGGDAEDDAGRASDIGQEAGAPRMDLGHCHPCDEILSYNSTPIEACYDDVGGAAADMSSRPMAGGGRTGNGDSAAASTAAPTADPTADPTLSCANDDAGVDPPCEALFSSASDVRHEAQAALPQLPFHSRFHSHFQSSTGSSRSSGSACIDLSPGQLGQVRYLQHFFRRSRAVRSSAWLRKGGLADLAVWRRVRQPACAHGQRLAAEAEFSAQQQLADEVFAWQRQYSLLLKRLQSGMAPMMLDLFCKAGGASEGGRRAGVATCGVDVELQPSYVARFGSDSFVLSDALDVSRLREVVRRLRPILIWASPPCQGYSAAAQLSGGSTAPRLIAVVRNVLTMIGAPFVIENVTGARRQMMNPTELWGQLFGLHCERARLFETGGGFTFTVPAALSVEGRGLQQHSCLGRRRRFPRVDAYGRVESTLGRRVCCEGNIWATQGTSSHFGSVVEHAGSMGIDRGHMTYAELSQAVPPAYASLIVGEAVMHILRTRFGLPVISFDEMRADTGRAKSMMQFWRRGAGGSSPSLGLSFVTADGRMARPGLDTSDLHSRAAACGARGELEFIEPLSGAAASRAARIAAHGAAEGHDASSGQLSFGRADSVWSLIESDFRELDYTHAGGYDRALVHGQAPNWSARLRPCQRVLPQALIEPAEWSGHNTFVHVPDYGREEWARRLASLAPRCESARLTVLIRVDQVPFLEAAGFRRVCSWHAGRAVMGGVERLPTPLQRETVALAYGRREVPMEGGSLLVHSTVEPYMDPRDRGAPSCGHGAKAALAWSYLHRHPERWRGKGMPPDVEQMMTEGVRIETVGDDQVYAREMPQYAFKDAEHFVRGSQECDRALICGHLELVPEDEVEWARANGSVHPWTVVHQSTDKWRSCQDYKAGTNPRVISEPFSLCTAHEVGHVVGPDSHFAKFDLRDGFWSVPVATASRHHLMVRHPATGRLLRCTSLPFGFSKSPQHFCRVTEAVAAKFRERVAGLGIHCFCFVDDFLICGDTKELTARGMKVFMALLEELGLPFAPHKTRGPTRVIEFLGFLLSNVEGARCVALTESRQAMMLSLIEEWMAKEPKPGGDALMVKPVELARVLGLFVFASEVVPNGRVYMQAMLRQFKGLEVDWARGLVRHLASQWSLVRIHDGFWRDLHWWRSALQRRNCMPLVKPVIGEVAVIGTDASDLACGELLWLDGAREETTLTFTEAERRRPINFRELRGTLRAFEMWGPRLRGRLALVETDNTFGHEATSKMRCKAEDMQELVRRIHELSMEHGFSIRSVHTPGAMLIRPDQTSRGAAPEEPRLRVDERVFTAIEQRFGPFDEFLGTERAFASGGRHEPELFSRLWAHPSFDTVGSTLRLICDRLTADPERCPRGVVVVPLAPEAGWWKLVRHFCVVGQWAAGGLSMQANVDGVWTPSHSQRPTLLLSFPRAGGMLVPLEEAVNMGTPAVAHALESHRKFAQLQRAWVNSRSMMPPGTLLYSARRRTPTELVDAGVHGAAGALYLTLDWYDGAGEPACAELRRFGTQRHHFALDAGSYDRRIGPVGPWRPDRSSLWVVNHLGGRLASQPAKGRGGKSERFIFDFDRAEAEIARMREALARADALEPIEAPAPVSPDFSRRTAEEDGDDAARPMSGYAGGPPPHPLRRVQEAEAAAEASDMEGSRRTLFDRPADGEGALEGGRPGLESRADRQRAASLPHRPNRHVPAPVAGVTEPTRCSYGPMVCSGCHEALGYDTWCIPGGSGMVHNNSECYAAAVFNLSKTAAAEYQGERARMRRAAGASNPPDEPQTRPVAAFDPRVLAPSVRAGAEEELPPPSVRPSGLEKNQRAAQLHEALSEERRLMIRECLEGRCQHAGSDEPRMTCIGSCHRQLHGVKCAQLSQGHATLAVFECHRCMLEKIASPPFSEDALRNAEETMILGLSSGAEGTGAGYADFVKLEAEWALTFGAGANVTLPSDHETSLKMFLTWLVRDKERSRSLGSLWRCIGSYQTKTGRKNLTQVASVKYHYSDLLEKHGIESQPRTSATPRMLKLCMDSVVEKHCPKPLICARTKLDIGMETGFGVRVGEALGSGDFHGMKAGHLSILRAIETNLETVEGMIEHSKTKFKRWVSCLGTTVGHAQLPLASLVRSYWQEAGFRVVSWTEGGFEITSVDYRVVRVSMLGMKPAQLDQLQKALELSRVSSVRKSVKATMKRARDRYEAKTSKDKRYINVFGSAADDADFAAVMLELHEAGLSSFVSSAEGPLLRSTDGGTLSHMPLDPSSTYGTLHAIMDDAHELANPEGDSDPWLDLQGLDSPLWGHHSFRRLADTVARATMAKSGASEQEIDLVFGWQEQMYSRKMQYHYETRFNRDRRYRVTMFL